MNTVDASLAASTKHGVVESLERALTKLIEIPAIVALVAEVGILFTGVTARFAFNRPLTWADELASITFLWLAMLGAVLALSRGEHMRMTALIDRVGPRTRAVLESAALMAPALFLAILLHPAIDYASGQAFAETPALGLPDSVRAGAVPVGIALMLATALLRMARHGSRDIAITLVVLAATALVLWGAAPALKALGNWNLIVFFAILLGAAVLAGVPIAFCFGLATVAYLLTVTSAPLEVVTSRIDEGVSSLVLLAIPLFILLGHLIVMTGMAAAMVGFLVSLVGHVRGGLSYVLLGAILLVSGISGAKTADMAAVAPVLFPDMKRRGIHDGELVSLLAASGAMAETIPPSIVLIIIGSVAGVSISALFTGGILPGLVLAAALAVVAKRRMVEPEGVVRRRPSWATIRSALVTALPALLLPVLIRTAAAGADPHCGHRGRRHRDRGLDHRHRLHRAGRSARLSSLRLAQAVSCAGAHRGTVRLDPVHHRRGHRDGLGADAVQLFARARCDDGVGPGRQIRLPADLDRRVHPARQYPRRPARDGAVWPAAVPGGQAARRA